MSESIFKSFRGLFSSIGPYNGLKGRNRGEALILLGSIIFAAGIPWSHVFGYVGIVAGLVGSFLCGGKYIFKANIKPVLLLMMMFFLWGLVLSVTVSINAGLGLNTVFAYFAHWFLPFLLGLWIAPRFKVPFLLVWVGSVLVLGFASLLAFAGLFDASVLSKEGMLWGRHHHIQFAAILFMAFQVLYGLFMTPKMERNKRTALFVSGLLILLFFILAGSRGWWVAAGFSLAGITLHHIFINRSRGIALIMVALGVVFVIGSIAAFPQVRARIDQTSFNDPNFLYRRNMAIMAVNIIRDHPLTGIGPGQVPLVKEYYDRMEKMNLPQETGYLEKKHLHNMYLQITAEFGFPGLVLFILIIGAVFRLLIKSAKREGNSPAAGIIYGIIWSFAALLIAESLDSLLRGPAVAMEIFWAIGICIGPGNDMIRLGRGPDCNKE